MAEDLGSRLRQERERRQIALESIASDTKINLSLLEALERDDVSRWPAGIFRRSFLRAYVQAIGLDPDPVLREFLELYPDPGVVVTPASIVLARAAAPAAEERPPTRFGVLLAAAVGRHHALNLRIADRLRPVLASVRRPRFAEGAVSQVSRAWQGLPKPGVASAVRRARRLRRLSRDTISQSFQSLRPSVVIKVSIVSDQSPFARGMLLRDLRCRWAAAACDAAMLTLVASTMFLVLDSFWASFAITTVCYYLASVVLLGNTPGICLCAPLDRARSGASPVPSMTRPQSAASQTAGT